MTTPSPLKLGAEVRAGRLIKKDVRPQPIEEMDVEATRRKVLELLHDGK